MHYYAPRIIAGFALGIWLASFGVRYFAALLPILLAGVFFIIFRRSIRFFSATLPIIFLAGSLGIAWFAVRDVGPPKILPQRPFDAVVVSEPDERENYTRYIVRTGGTKVLVFANQNALLQYGDIVRVDGDLKEPENLTSDFDWKAYLAKDGIYLQAFHPGIEKIGEQKSLRRFLFGVKGRFLSAINRVIPEPHSAFLGGVTVGAKRAIPKKLQDEFRTVGITHIVVLSGYNVTIVAESLIRVLRALPYALGTAFGFIGIILFALMTGAAPAIVRASIMAAIVLLGRATGRMYAASWALIIAGFVMVAASPKILRFDLGFQLSFLATLGLIYMEPFIEKRLNWLTERLGIRGTVSATMSAQLAVLPLILYKIGDLSLVALPVNALILMFIPATMFFGFATGVLGMLSPLISVPFGWISYALLQYELFIVSVFSKLPFAKLTLPYFPLPLMLAAYAALFYAVRSRSQPHP